MLRVYRWCDDDDVIGAVECIWAIECVCWCDTVDGDIGAVESIWAIECDWW